MKSTLSYLSFILFAILMHGDSFATNTVAERKDLERRFQQAQGSELKALEHQQAMQRTELDSSQKAAWKEWINAEKAKIHEFHKEHPQGPEFRAFMKDFKVRRDGFVKMQKDDRARILQEQKVHSAALKDDQNSKRQEFQQFLDRGEAPPQRLWPTGH